METPRPNYGISRIDQPEKKNHGFYVRITHRGHTHQKYFPDKANKGKSKALKAAREFRDGILAKLPKSKQQAASQKRRRVKQSGVTGVTHVISKTADKTVYEYWQAAWIDADGRRRTAKFSISRYGNDKSLDLAKKARRKAARATATSPNPKGTSAAAKPAAARKKKTTAKTAKAKPKAKAKAAPKKAGKKPGTKKKKK